MFPQWAKAFIRPIDGGVTAKRLRDTRVLWPLDLRRAIGATSFFRW
jgi:hypothetical protein